MLMNKKSSGGLIPLISRILCSAVTKIGTLSFGLRLLIYFLSAVVAVQAENEWEPPVGVPHPGFGIEEKHTMYKGQVWDSLSEDGLIPYKDAGSGPYTHYVDNSDPNATDSGNPFGSPETPRKTWPFNLPAGSVVEVHGGPYLIKNYSDKAGINSQGTKEKPVFFRGVSKSDAPIFSKDLHLFGSYFIVENLHFANRRINLRQDLLKANIDHIVIRDIRMVGTGQNIGMTSAISIGLWAVPSDFTISNVMVKDCEITDFGDRFALQENDAGGVVVSGFDTFNTWILENKISRMSGDSVRVGKNAGGLYVSNSSKVYIGRNIFADNKEDAIDIKQMADIVISENDLIGTVIIHYDCKNVWLINNLVHNSKNGFISTGVVDLYILGNIFRDISVKAIQFWGRGEIHIANNTITKVGSGIWNAGGGDEPKPIYNNIIANLNGNTETNYHIYYNNTGLAKTSALQNNLFWQNNQPIRINWGGRVYTDVGMLKLAGHSMESGSIQEDPKFLDARRNNFKIALNSAGIDQGVFTPYNDLYRRLFGVSLSWDADRQQRLKDGDRDGTPKLDIGAIEFDPDAPPRPPRNLRVTDVSTR